MRVEKSIAAAFAMSEEVMLPNATDVLIVGAGPTGLALAAKLALAGVDFVLVDRLPEGANTSRAAVVHARTLEVLEELGITEELVRHGIKVSRFSVRDRDRPILTIRFDRLPTRYPYTLIPQQQTEAILLDRLRALGRRVYRPYSVVDLRQDVQGVDAKVAADGASTQRIRARYIVGADGMHSLVRERAGIGFTGDVYEQSFVLADVRLRWALEREEVRLFFSPDGLVVIAPLPGGLHRIVATVDSAPEHPSWPISNNCSTRAVRSPALHGLTRSYGSRASECITG